MSVHAVIRNNPPTACLRQKPEYGRPFACFITPLGRAFLPQIIARCRRVAQLVWPLLIVAVAVGGIGLVVHPVYGLGKVSRAGD